MKKLFVIAIAAFAFTACNNSAKPEETTNADSATATEQPAAPAETPATPVDTAAAPVTPAPAETPAK